MPWAAEGASGACAGAARLASDWDGVIVREADMSERSLIPEGEHK
jgi:hypothetical protein